jgi:hypothetical protein
MLTLDRNLRFRYRRMDELVTARWNFGAPSSP